MYVWSLITDYIDHGRQSSIPDTYILNIIFENDICWFINIVINSSFRYIHTYECSIDNRLDRAYLYQVSTEWFLAALVGIEGKGYVDRHQRMMTDVQVHQDLPSIHTISQYQWAQCLQVYCFWPQKKLLPVREQMAVRTIAITHTPNPLTKNYEYF